MRLALGLALLSLVGCATARRSIPARDEGGGSGFTALPPLQLEVFGQSLPPAGSGAGTGDATLAGTQTFTGAKTFSATTVHSGAVDLQGTVADSTGNLTIGDTVDVSGTIMSSRASGTSALDIQAGSRICMRSGGDNGASCFGNNFLSTDSSGFLNYIGGMITTTYKVTRAALPTCNAAAEGTLATDSLSGLATGAATRFCGCQSNGSSTYAWKNIITGTNGTTTTCAD
jgi:hypothetical protein